jgi:predicted CxxxxCH...CXXCH cytochrome family protein
LTDPFTPCVSCHAQPPNGADDLGNRPNRSGAHLPIHQVLPKVGNVCNTCHNGAGTGSPLHFDRQAPATVSFLPAYNAKNGTARRNADGSCSSVSCHGGQDAPNWFTGSIDRTTQCTVCHQVGTGPQTPQFNSPYSGEHGLGPHVTRGCTACHDPQLLEPAAERHYGGLDTPGFEIDAQTTLRAGLNYAPTSQIPPRGICDPSDFTGCHGARVWQ